MKKLYLFLLLTFTLVSNSQCWDLTESLTTGFTKIKFFDNQTGIAFGSGSMIRTTDGGANWNLVRLPATSTGGQMFTDIAMLSINAAIVYGEQGTLLKTINKGLSWEPIPLNIKGFENITGIDFIDGNVGYLKCNSTGSNYFMKTIDGGENWTIILNDVYGNVLRNDKIRFYNELIGYSWGMYGLHKTIDGGISWSNIVVPANFKEIKLTHSGSLILCTNNGLSKFYISNNGGQTWEQIQQLSSDNGIYITSTAFEIFGNKIYLLSETYNTTPFQKHLLSYDISSTSISTQNLGLQLNKLVDINVVNSNIIFIIGSHGFGYMYGEGRQIIKSDNGGISWLELDSILFTDSNNDFKIFQNNSTTFTGGRTRDIGTETYFYIYTSVNDGATWQQKLKVEGYNANLVHAENNYISYTIYRNNMYHFCESFDLGNTWSVNTINNPEYSFSGLKQINQNTLLLSNNINSYISFDKGVTWTTIPRPFVPNVSFSRFKYVSQSEVYAYGLYNNWPVNYSYYLYKSTDLGQSWSEVLVIPAYNGANQGSIGSETNFHNNWAFISTGFGKFYKANLQTGTYSLHNVINPLTGVEDMISENSLYIINDTNWIHKGLCIISFSNDQGQTWKKVSSLCHNGVLYNQANNEIVVYDKGAGGILRHKGYMPTPPKILGNTSPVINTVQTYYITNDRSAKAIWNVVGGTIVNDSSPNDYIEVLWNQEGNYTIEAKYINSCGESTSYSKDITVYSTLSNSTVNIDNINIYPNPFNNEVKIETTGLIGDKLDIKIISLTGQTIFSNTFINSENIIIDNLDYISPGMYLIIINDDNNQYFRKILKM